MAETAAQVELRGMIGESIPVDGSDADTMVSEELLQAWIDNSDNLNLAAIKGWRFKVAQWAGLVNVTDGAASRNFSDLMAHGNIMIDMYMDIAKGPAFGRTRVGKIVRE